MRRSTLTPKQFTSSGETVCLCTRVDVCAWWWVAGLMGWCPWVTQEKVPERINGCEKLHRVFPASERQGARRPPFGEFTVRPYPLLTLHLLILFHLFSFSLSKQKSLFTRGENNSLSHPPQETFKPVCPSPKRKKNLPDPTNTPTGMPAAAVHNTRQH